MNLNIIRFFADAIEIWEITWRGERMAFWKSFTNMVAQTPERRWRRIPDFEEVRRRKSTVEDEVR